MSKSIIFTGGGSPNSFPDGLLEDGDVIIAADSGLDVALRLGFTVDLWIGDLDSTTIDPSSFTGTIQTYSREKDMSDTELALQQCKGNQYVLVGGGGYRLDHLFGLFALFSKYGPPICWLTSYEEMFLVKEKKVIFKGWKDRTVSLFPSTLESMTKVTAKQLVWPLDSYMLGMHSISLSNRMTDSELEIEVVGDAGIFVSFPVAQTHS